MRPRYWISARGLALYSRIVGFTARYQVHGRARVETLLKSGQPFIGASWHGVSMMTVGFMLAELRNVLADLKSIVPDDWRGEILAEYTRLLGIKVFAVSMEEESLSAARRLLQVVHHLRNGGTSFIFPDGPDGPSRVPKPGVAFLAGRAGAPILPYGVHTTTRYQLRRWDRFSVPFPFSRITISVGDPLFIGRHEDPRVARTRIADAIDRAMADAEERHQSWSRR